MDENNLPIISRGYDLVICKSDLDSFVKSSNLRRANFVIMRRTYRTLNDCEMQHNAEVGLFTRPSNLMFNILYLHEELKILPVYIALSALKIYRAAKKKSVPAAKVV